MHLHYSRLQLLLPWRPLGTPAHAQPKGPGTQADPMWGMPHPQHMHQRTAVGGTLPHINGGKATFLPEFKQRQCDPKTCADVIRVLCQATLGQGLQEVGKLCPLCQDLHARPCEGRNEGHCGHWTAQQWQRLLMSRPRGGGNYQRS